MLRFTIFGIPVEVEPWFWLTGAILGGGFHALGSNDPNAFMWVAAWMIICFISVLVHELGHAVTGIRLAGGSTWIKLWAMGGLAYHQGSRFTQKTRALMILAGPGAGICLFLLVAAIMMVLWPNGVGLEILWRWMILNQNPNELSREALIVFADNIPKMRVFDIFVWINFWWSMVNLLPVYPLDGGQLVGCYMKSRKTLHKIGMITGVVVAALGIIYLGSLYVALLFGYLAYQNYLGYQQAGY